MAQVSLKDVSKVYPGGVTAVNKVSLGIENKEFMVLVGPSGCGKSTTLRMIAGLEEISSGELYLGDKLVNDVPAKDRDIAMVFQNYALYPHMTVFENMAFGSKLRHYGKAEIRQRVNEAADILGIKHLLHRRPKELSGGERQRVAVGRAIVRKPMVFLFDEPLSNLDAKLREQMRFELKDLQRRTGIPILYVTHDQAEALAMSDRLAVMNAGRIIQVGAPTEIYVHPADRFVADFIGLMNFLPGRVLGRSGEEATVEFLGGHRLNVADRSGLSGGCVVAVRPEDISLSLTGPIRCRVEVRNYSGNLVDYKVRADDAVLRVQTPKTEIFAEGKELGITIHRAMLFQLGEGRGSG